MQNNMLNITTLTTSLLIKFPAGYEKNISDMNTSSSWLLSVANCAELVNSYCQMNAILNLMWVIE